MTATQRKKLAHSYPNKPNWKTPRDLLERHMPSRPDEVENYHSSSNEMKN